VLPKASVLRSLCYTCGSIFCKFYVRELYLTFHSVVTVVLLLFCCYCSVGQKGLRVLDLACGKGGDLSKWCKHKDSIQSYVGMDIAKQSLIDLTERIAGKCTYLCVLQAVIVYRSMHKNLFE
jgi:2-polyprenyl-3-methyl-5-hydroxy-6-metoxy-1,4-benzoquinol methylase